MILFVLCSRHLKSGVSHAILAHKHAVKVGKGSVVTNSGSTQTGVLRLEENVTGIGIHSTENRRFVSVLVTLKVNANQERTRVGSYAFNESVNGRLIVRNVVGIHINRRLIINIRKRTKAFAGFVEEI